MFSCTALSSEIHFIKFQPCKKFILDIEVLRIIFYICHQIESVKVHSSVDVNNVTSCVDVRSDCETILEKHPDVCSVYPDYSWHNCRHTCGIDGNNQLNKKKSVSKNILSFVVQRHNLMAVIVSHITCHVKVQRRMCFFFFSVCHLANIRCSDDATLEVDETGSRVNSSDAIGHGEVG